MSSAAEPLRIGVIGCGAFGLFALQQFAQSSGVAPVGMAGTAREPARAAARRFGMPDILDVEKLVTRPDIDLVYVATPPFLHHQQALMALSAGKHVICEKPLTLTLEQADELIALAHGRGLLLVANLMQRYNPVFDAVRRLIRSKALGEVLHGHFENYASDEGLSQEHWFWDREKSGGIFVEHGVHFFDLFAGWLGPGEVVSAQRAVRPGTALEDQVQCTVRYSDTVLVNFYHGFHQPGRLDRQELRLVFERGDLALSEWVPTRARIRAVVDEGDTRELLECFSGARLDVEESYGGHDRNCRGRGKALDVYQKIDLSWGEGRDKLPVYCELLRNMFEDQLAWIRNRDHERRITEENGRNSLALARAADRLARSPEKRSSATGDRGEEA